MIALKSIHARPLQIPFKVIFKHASATRATTQSLWVEVMDQEGGTGYGEGCPREYVTAESMAGALSFVAEHRDRWLEEIVDLPSLSRWVAEHRALIDASPAAWCAVELALLDLFGKQSAQPVEALLGLPTLQGAFHYSAVLGDSSAERFGAELAHYRQVGFTDFKIKLSGDVQRDRAKLDSLRAAGITEAKVRADANNLWQRHEEAVAFLTALQFSFWAIEEPLTSGDYAGMTQIAETLKTRIILDESFARRDQVHLLTAQPTQWVVNLRVSKMGGLLRSLDVIEELRRHSVRIILGVHVGETSLLTRAALVIANISEDLLLAQEGAFGTHLLSRDVVEPSMRFGEGGTLRASSLSADGPGWGLRIQAS